MLKRIISVILVITLLVMTQNIGTLATDPEVVQTIACGESFTLALKTDGSLWAWGYNVYGQLGDGTTEDKSLPVLIIESGVQAIAAGRDHATALKTDGSLWVWGGNQQGQLGDGNPGIFNNSTVPKLIISSGVTAVAAGRDHTIALKTDGSLWAWGYNGSGQLGDGTTVKKSTPQLIIASGVQKIAAGYNRTYAFMTDGSLWAWGSNSNGELGDGTTTNKISPQQIFASGVSGVAVGQLHSLAVKDDSSLWVWGLNVYGQFGNGLTEFLPNPVPQQILANGVTAAAAGESHSIALMTDGSLWAWGNNSHGQVGDNTTEQTKPNPVMIIDSNVQKISAGFYHSLSLKTDDTVWAWGSNSYGQLGNGNPGYNNDSLIPELILESGEPYFPLDFESYIVDGTIIKNFTATTDAATFLSNITFGGNTNIRVFNKNDVELTPSQNMGTGAKVKVYIDEVETDVYTVVRYGDINGDGIINGTDTLMINRYLSGLYAIQGIYLIPADVTRDGNINGTDTLKINRFLSGLTTPINQG